MRNHSTCRGLTVFFLAVPGVFAAFAAPARAEDGCSVTPSPGWKSEIVFPEDPFRRGYEWHVPAWTKFTILLCDAERVYFQDSRKYQFHYDFATSHLDPLVGMGRQEFDQATLYKEGREAVLGAVVEPSPARTVRPLEFGIQLIGRDPFDPEEVVELFRRVEQSVDAPPEATVFYFPTYEQSAVAREHGGFLAAHGIEVSSPGRWAVDSVVYSEGWALGTLRFFAAGEIESAYRDGRLGPEDILLTDGVPAEVPFVAGIVSLAPATPSSHVAILARDFGIPFVHTALERDAKRAEDLVGHQIVLRARVDDVLPNVRLLDTDGELDPASTAEILQLKELPALDIAPKRTSGSYGLPVSGLEPSDIRFVGGKAANYGVLLEALPENTRVAAAFTFDLWDAFLDQDLRSGASLRESIAERLLPHASYPPADMSALVDALHDIRDLIKDEGETAFSPALRDAVIATLTDPRYGFQFAIKLRFRSSTNMEDADRFTGAGLYDSVSGCLADDLDGDETGPSLCDAGWNEERGVFRAIRRVFASFYRENAYLERLRWGIDEDDVGMGVLVHHSFPDPEELANGVATARLSPSGTEWRVRLVTQLGPTSVSNPEDDSIPEDVDVWVRATGSNAQINVRSNLVLLGETVLRWKEEYLELAGLLVAAAEEFERQVGVTGRTLDFEYKKVEAEGLVVKQIRSLPDPDTEPSVTPFLLNEPMELVTLQGPRYNVLSNHRMKTRWNLETRNMWLTAGNIAEGVYANVDVTFTDGCEIRALRDELASFPNATHIWDGEAVEDSWRLESLSNPRTYRLVTRNIPTLVAPSESPIVTQRDFLERELRAEYDFPVLVLDDLLEERLTQSETVSIAEPLERLPTDLLQVRRMSDGKGRVIESRFYWPDGTEGSHRPPEEPATDSTGSLIVKTASLVRWVETRLTGWTTDPIVLRSEFSQSYWPMKHNWFENFVFSPRLDPDVSAEAHAELRAQGIHLIYATDFWDGSGIRVLSEDEVGHACGSCVMTPRGNVNGDEETDLSDAVYVLLYLFAGGPPPLAPEAIADVNADGILDMSDPVSLLQHLFAGGPAPPPACL